jgi:hypothetical protein
VIGLVRIVFAVNPSAPGVTSLWRFSDTFEGKWQQNAPNDRQREAMALGYFRFRNRGDAESATISRFNDTFALNSRFRPPAPGHPKSLIRTLFWDRKSRETRGKAKEANKTLRDKIEGWNCLAKWSSVFTHKK